VPGQSSAQVGREVPSSAYFAALEQLNQGDLEGANAAFLGVSTAGIKSANGQWIDSICPYAMAGECCYQLGRHADAIDQFRRALQLYKGYSNWLQRVEFPASLAAGNPTVVPWGQSTRNLHPAQFAETYRMSQGSYNAADVLKKGGTLESPVIFPAHVLEVVRCTALAQRRLQELLGPTAPYDELVKEVSETISRRPVAANHWSQSFVDAQLGIAQAGLANAGASAMLTRGLLVQGEFTHPLSPGVLLCLGRISLDSGDTKAAAEYFLEASYAGASFGDFIAIEEALRYGTLIHILGNQQGIYPPLAPALVWAKGRNMPLYASLLLLSAENFAALGETAPAARMLADAHATMSRSTLSKGLLGMRMKYLDAVVSYQSNNIRSGNSALSAAIDDASRGSLWMFHIGLVDRLISSGSVGSQRLALSLYNTVLRDPANQDWLLQPLDSLATLAVPHPRPYEHWFELVAETEDVDLAMEISDRLRRHRFLATLPMGGRMLQLRWLLETPPEQLPTDLARLQRQDLLTRYPKYDEAVKDIRSALAALRGKSPAPEDKDAAKELSRQLGKIAELSQVQEGLLRPMGVGRYPVETLFPPLKKAKQVQAALPSGHALLAFLHTEQHWYGFLYNQNQSRLWRIEDGELLQKQITAVLRDLGNYDANHQLTLADLGKHPWEKSAQAVYRTLFHKSGVNLAMKFDELVVVPDGMLWYFPFEVLPPGESEHEPLLTKVRLRYAPTIGLSVAEKITQPQHPQVGLVFGKLHPREEDATWKEAKKQMEENLAGSTIWPGAPSGGQATYRLLFDQFLVLDEIKPSEGEPYDFQLGSNEKNKSAHVMSDWMSAALGGPRQVLLPGFRTSAENCFKKGTHDGSDVFLATCGLMSTGTRTVLLSRWRMGGQTSYDLTREFTRELPNLSAAEAWQRSVELAMASPLLADREPRLKKPAALDTQLPPAAHPLFWSGYMLVDRGKVPDALALEAPKQESPPPPKKLPDAKMPNDNPPAVGDRLPAAKLPAEGEITPSTDDPIFGEPPSKKPRKDDNTTEH
jgi:tetratricopeptide (TPR) repeat protein